MAETTAEKVVLPTPAEYAAALDEIHWEKAIELVRHLDAADGWEPKPTLADIGAAWTFANGLRLYGEGIVDESEKVMAALSYLDQSLDLGEREGA